MSTLKRLSPNAKSGQNETRKKGISHYRTLLTVALSEGDTLNAKRYEAIIKRLESDEQKSKKN
jgi:hypothetical protein